MTAPGPPPADTAPATTADYFLHIPKTAGTTFISILHQQYDTAATCPAFLWPALLQLPPRSRQRYELYRGHFYGYLKRVIHRPLRTVTFLREPIERSLSHYAHVLREPGHYFHGLARAQGSLLAFLDDPRTSALITNYQTRSLAQDLDPVAMAAGLPPEEQGSLLLQQRLETTMPADTAGADLLRRAEVALADCAYVGITERFDESLAGMAEALGWSRPVSSTWLNAYPDRVQAVGLDDATLESLSRHTELDRALYADAVTAFEARQSTSGAPAAGSSRPIDDRGHGR